MTAYATITVKPRIYLWDGNKLDIPLAPYDGEIPWFQYRRLTVKLEG